VERTECKSCGKKFLQFLPHHGSKYCLACLTSGRTQPLDYLVDDQECKSCGELFLLTSSHDRLCPKCRLPKCTSCGERFRPMSERELRSKALEASGVSYKEMSESMPSEICPGCEEKTECEECGTKFKRTKHRGKHAHFGEGERDSFTRLAVCKDCQRLMKWICDIRAKNAPGEKIVGSSLRCRTCGRWHNDIHRKIITYGERDVRDYYSPFDGRCKCWLLRALDEPDHNNEADQFSIKKRLAEIATHFSARTILFVDDEESMHKKIKILLSKMKRCELIHAYSCTEAVDCINDRLDIDVVFLDAGLAGALQLWSALDDPYPLGDQSQWSEWLRFFLESEGPHIGSLRDLRVAVNRPMELFFHFPKAVFKAHCHNISRNKIHAQFEWPTRPLGETVRFCLELDDDVRIDGEGEATPLGFSRESNLEIEFTQLSQRSRQLIHELLSQYIDELSSKPSPIVDSARDHIRAFLVAPEGMRETSEDLAGLKKTITWKFEHTLLLRAIHGLSLKSFP